MKRYILAAAALSFCVACEQHVAVPENSAAEKAPAAEEKKATPPAETPAPAAPAVEAPAPAPVVEEKKPEAAAEPAPAAPVEEKKPEAPAAEPKP